MYQFSTVKTCTNPATAITTVAIKRWSNTGWRNTQYPGVKRATVYTKMSAASMLRIYKLVTGWHAVGWQDITRRQPKDLPPIRTYLLDNN